MADIKWIKITTDIFDDEKLKIIDTMPARDEIIVIWFKLLALSGKVNQNGLLFMNSKVAYTPEMLSAIFNREVQSIRFALTTFEQFGMIDIEDNEVIAITNWEKHQNIDGMDKIREQNKIRQQKHREKQKVLTNSNVTVTLHNATDKEKEEDKELKDMYEIGFKKVRSMYKGTKTLANAKKKLPQLIKLYGVEQMIRTVERYNAYIVKQRKIQPSLNYLNESTFWNGRYEDYLDENVNELEVTRPVIQDTVYIEV
jgi:predicted phage replisome organizer